MLYYFFVAVIYTLPALLTLIHDKITYGQALTKGVTFNRLLACYGIYMLGLLFYTVWEPIEYYVNVYSCSNFPPSDWCGGFWYSLGHDIETWLLPVSLITALISQVIYIHYIANLNKLSSGV
ncbi:hypothetical protein BTO01_26655 [Vibrio jasicida]|uniref:hypothetical protein n=1 Tax=Vibrio jasicida TaxID=766224 RepID=UPI000CF55517|nr:hypothetical protein [Vibrio jasicida]PQJ49072.1 hypothetical protein BTO01_26655 [Vibrio jasicida]